MLEDLIFIEVVAFGMLKYIRDWKRACSFLMYVNSGNTLYKWASEH